MNHEHCNLEDKPLHLGHKKPISWTAVITGALVGIGLSFLLNLFSVAIGLSMVTTTKEGITSLAIGGFIGLLIGTIVSMFVAGFTAGFLGRLHCLKHNLGVIYGFTSWCLALILTVLLASSMANYVSSYTNLVTHSATPTTAVIINNETAPAISTLSSTHHTDVVVNAQEATNTLGISALFIFILFFVGAAASCFGGHYGMSCDSTCCRKPDETI